MKACQVVGIVREVGIHFEDILIVAFQGPLEARDVGCAQSQFSSPLNHEKTVSELIHQRLHDVSGAVRAIIVYNQDIKSHRQVEHVANDFLNVLLFLVGGNDD